MSGQGKVLPMLGKQQHRRKSFLLFNPQLLIYPITGILSHPRERQLCAAEDTGF